MSPTEEQTQSLLAVAGVLRTLLAQVARSEVLGRYRAGQVLRDLMLAPSTYGERCLERIGAELGVAPATLYRYVAVATRWSEADILADGARVNLHGQPLSWSHFVVLSRVTEASLRGELIEETLARAWSSRELALHTASLVGRPDETDLSTLDAVKIALEEGIGTAARATLDVDLFAKALSERLADLDATASERLMPRAIGAFEDLRARVEGILIQLHRAHAGERTSSRETPALRVTSDVRRTDPASEKDEVSDSGLRVPVTRPPRRT